MVEFKTKQGEPDDFDVDRSVFFEIDSDPIVSRGDNLSEMANRPGVVRALNYIIRQAVLLRASDVHLEPASVSCSMRYRIDGDLRELPATPLRVGQALISRIKILSGMDISKRRIPQDGRLYWKEEGKEIEFRVSSLPTVFGEGVAMRILNRTATRHDLQSAGMDPKTLGLFEESINRANGIVLLTGPTGSGKTTTLYGGLNKLNQEDVKIITAEEPVEYDMNGVMQVEIDDKVGLTFARALRSMLRQDPDIILVGEIRDAETAKIATEAAMTGHLVLSTLHTRDASSAVTRLIDLGVEPYLVSDTLVAVMAQRLIRRVCDLCKKPANAFRFPPGVDPALFKPWNFQEGAGCAECNHSGFRGRTGLFELMIVEDALRDLVESGAPAEELRQAAKKQGTESLRACGFRKVGEGVTTIKEVWAATPDAV